MKTIKFMLGCDPEIFLQDKEGYLKSVIGKIGGSKEAPLPLLELGDGFAVQEDNVAMEFNIPPAKQAQEFVDSIQKCLKHLKEGMEQSFGLTTSPLSAAHFSDEELVDPRARMFGCDPDYNAWTGRRNPRPHAKDANLRSCGGHIHIGVDVKQLPYPVSDKTYPMESHESAVGRKLIKAMDLFVGVPSILMDKGELRRELYGKAGAYRQKPYGVEYRTLSNFWTLTPNLCQWVWDNTDRAVSAVESQLSFEEDKELILGAINSNNKEIAKALVEKYQLEVINV